MFRTNFFKTVITFKILFLDFEFLKVGNEQLIEFKTIPGSSPPPPPRDFVCVCPTLPSLSGLIFGHQKLGSSLNLFFTVR